MNIPQLCIESCAYKGYSFAGVQNGKECFCGDDEPPKTRFASESECDKPCSGDSSLMCGGGYRMNVYEISKIILKFSKITVSFKGEDDISDTNCVEQPHNKLLPFYAYGNSSNTPDVCLAACYENAYKFAGVKWSKECWCGDTAPPGSSYTAPAHCNMPCSGDETIMCGAGHVLNLYKTGDVLVSTIFLTGIC